VQKFVTSPLANHQNNVVVLD
jgi:hypothetical protein